MVILLTRRHSEKSGMIDIHCHILPQMDDGARDVAQAGAMMAAQRACGVDAMYLTPHFYPDETPLEDFLSARSSAWDALCDAMNPRDLSSVRLGAEVRYCQSLLSLDVEKVTLGGGSYLLLELPGQRYPAYIKRITEALLEKGLTPILAHVERYAYFREDPDLLKGLIDLGALAQVSAQALLDKRDKHFSLACLQHGLAQIVATDAHDLTNRKPCMDQIHKLPKELQQLHNEFSEAVWANELPPYLRATHVKKTFFGYR